jgi:hypothetical protein
MMRRKRPLKQIGGGFTAVLTDQRDRFAALIQKNDESFKKTTEQASAQFRATMQKSQESLNNVTGGSSYPLVKMVPIPMSGTINTLRLSIVVMGRNPLFDVIVTLRKLPVPATLNATDLVTTGGDSTNELNVPSLTTAGDYSLPVPIEPSLSGESDYVITTIARNGLFAEKLSIRNVAPGVLIDKDNFSPWEQSWIITRGLGRSAKVIAKKAWHKTRLNGAKLVQP